MLKNRLVFTLLYNDGNYMLSRNFRLQRVGNLDWLKSAYHFDAIAFSIDELVVLNVEREIKNTDAFVKHVTQLSKECFMPIAAGGGIRSLADGYSLMHAGADKLVVNSIIFDDPRVVGQLVRTFGSQAVVASIDCKKDGVLYKVYKHNGNVDSGMSILDAVRHVEKLGVGEIYLTSIDRDGTGQGYDMNLIKIVSSQTRLPVIAAGGIGKYEHFLEGMEKCGITATATANIYNFLVDGLKKAREYLKRNSVQLATWDYDVEYLRGSVKRSKKN